jgi:hypothetical protein
VAPVLGAAFEVNGDIEVENNSSSKANVFGKPNVE